MSEKVTKTDADWRDNLTPEQYQVLRLKGTEPPFSGKYCDEKSSGNYVCAGCGEALFASDTKFESRSGWPSFWQPSNPEHVVDIEDASYGMVRTEVLCAACDAHLGHVFPDGPAPTNLRYCINSVAIKHVPTSEADD